MRRLKKNSIIGIADWQFSICDWLESVPPRANWSISNGQWQIKWPARFAELVLSSHPSEPNWKSHHRIGARVMGCARKSERWLYSRDV